VWAQPGAGRGGRGPPAWRPGPGVAAGTGYLITDLGVKYTLGDSGTAGPLGLLQRHAAAARVCAPAYRAEAGKAGAVRTVPMTGQ
jgi:hypothetical protein